MAMPDEVARYQLAQQSHAWRYQEWTAKDALALAEYIRTYVSEGMVLRAHRGLDAEGLEVLWFEAHKAGAAGMEAAANGGINISKPCPPLC